jgi:4'-phosphopantetheinyl transferase
MTEAVVHLACARVDDLLPQLPAPHASWLSPQEQQRLAHISTDTRRGQFLAARWQARLLLARASASEAGSWRVTAPEAAPPRVEGRDDLYLSISHSGGWVACAVAATPIGLDLEAPRRRRDIDGLVDLCCTPREQAGFEGLDAKQRETLFYELWTVKEAWIKRRGDWVAPQRLRQVEAGAGTAADAWTWRVRDWTLALCAPGVRSVRWWSPLPPLTRSWAVCDAAVSEPGAA